MKLLSVLLFLFILGIGFNALTYKNSVFADSLAPCCNVAGCENTDPSNGPDCYTSSLVALCGQVEEVKINCKTCVDYTVSNCICEWNGSNYCVYPDGTIYTGTLVNCPQK
jgi:hypothetical protein